MSQLHLLLADEDRPLLPEGAAQDLLGRATPVEAERRKDVDHLYSEDNTNDLAEQRWAIVYPKARPELLDLIGPLRALRESQQRAKVLTWALGPEEDGRALYREIYDGKLKRAEQPRYVLILGDLDEIQLSVQLRLAGAGAIGRLAFDRPEDYRAYADKAVSWDGREQGPEARTLLYGAYDAYDGAMHAGEQDLLAEVERGAPGSVQSFGRMRQAPLDGMRDLLQIAAEERPTVLLSVTHGLGSGRWSPEERRRRQGAMRLQSGVAVEAEQLRDRPFLPGGLWAYFACFGAGTPSRSRYAPWLQDLVETGELSGAPDVLQTLSKDRPFVSALTRAALANPRGPLGVLGHVDLAWGWSFRDESAGGASRAQRFASLLRSASEGDRFGLNLSAISNVQRGIGDRLLEYTEQEREGSLTPQDRALRGHDWMTWHDLGSWVLLGDPAARLPLTQAPPVPVDHLLPFSTQSTTQTAQPDTQQTAAAPAGPDLDTLETLVLAKLAGEPDVRTRAEAMGVGWPELRRLEQTYTEAGRRALAALRR